MLVLNSILSLLSFLLFCLNYWVIASTFYFDAYIDIALDNRLPEMLSNSELRAKPNNKRILPLTQIDVALKGIVILISISH